MTVTESLYDMEPCQREEWVGNCGIDCIVFQNGECESPFDIIDLNQKDIAVVAWVYIMSSKYTGE